MSRWSSSTGPRSADGAARSPRTCAEVVEKLVDAACGLAAAHAVGIVHRDFKPSNVLIGPDERARVTDFGLARRIDVAWRTDALTSTSATDPEAPVAGDGTGSTRSPLSAPGFVVGTLRYMAPEQHRGALVDERADQYAFCVTAWELLAGRPPFASASARKLCAAKTAGPPPFPSPAVPSRVAQVITRGMAPRPEDRFESMEALVDALAAPRRPNVALVGAALLVAS